MQRNLLVLGALLLASSSFAARLRVDPVYERPYIGGFLSAKNSPPPAGYTLMSLEDIRSPSFVEYYNNRGVDFMQPFPSGTLCCIILTASGYLAYGPTTNLSYLEPFQGSEDVCTTGYMPNRTTFGGGPISPEPLYYVPIPKLNATSLANLHTTTTCPVIDNECNMGGAAFTAYFKLNAPPPSPSPSPSSNEYKLQQIGPNYPAPSNGWEQASLDDVKGADFAAFYNKNGLKITQRETENYCCMIQVKEGGWLMYGASPGRSPLSTCDSGTAIWDCSTVNSTLNLFATFGGNYDNIPFPTINSSMTSQISLLFNDSAMDFDGCIGLNNTLALFKRSSTTSYRYKIQQIGPNYPAPSNGWEMASFDQLKSDDFAAFYNKNGIEITQSETENYCCMIQVKEGGWVMYGAAPGRTPITTFDAQGGWSCATANITLQFGTYFGGNYMNTFFPTWNSSVAGNLSLLQNNTKDFDGCQPLPNTLALWRQPL